LTAGHPTARGECSICTGYFDGPNPTANLASVVKSEEEAGFETDAASYSTGRNLVAKYAAGCLSRSQARSVHEGDPGPGSFAVRGPVSGEKAPSFG
jgi:hypothetical protein